MRTLILRSLLTLSLGAAAVVPALAQRRYTKDFKEPELSEPRGWSLGVTVGLSDLWGDVGTRSPVDHYTNSEYWSNTKYMGGLYVRYAFHPAIAARLSASFGTLYAHDNWNKTKAEKASSYNDDAVQRYVRNQDIRSRVWEGTLMAEFTPLRLNEESRGARRRFQPYLTVGVGAVNYRPQSTWTSRPGFSSGGYGQYVDIYNLHIEGDGWDFEGAAEREDRWQLVIPAGLGVRWDLGSRLGLGVEYVHRFMRTDFLDGVSDKYIPQSYYFAQMPAGSAVQAMDIADKSWQVLQSENFRHQPGEVRGDVSNNDAYSTLSVNFYFKINNRKNPWWN